MASPPVRGLQPDVKVRSANLRHALNTCAAATSVVGGGAAALGAGGVAVGSAAFAGGCSWLAAAVLDWWTKDPPRLDRTIEWYERPTWIAEFRRVRWLDPASAYGRSALAVAVAGDYLLRGVERLMAEDEQPSDTVLLVLQGEALGRNADRFVHELHWLARNARAVARDRSPFEADEVSHGLLFQDLLHRAAEQLKLPLWTPVQEDGTTFEVESRTNVDLRSAVDDIMGLFGAVSRSADDLARIVVNSANFLVWASSG